MHSDLLYIPSSVITSFFIGFILNFLLIYLFKSKNIFNQPIREDGPKSHISKKKQIPTMGGILIFTAFFINIFIWIQPKTNYFWISLLSIICFCILGGIDDFLKIKNQNHYGLSVRNRLVIEIIISILLVMFIYKTFLGNCKFTEVTIRFLKKSTTIDLGMFYFFLAPFIIVGTANAVNLTDGLDGLAIIPIITSILIFCLISFLSSDINLSKFFKLPYIQNQREITIICSSLVGSCLSFLWYNTHPAKIFMGDTGSLSLGSLLGVISIMLKQEFILVIVGLIFILETISVIIQVLYFKKKHKRFFLMAPLHHHFEKMGIPEENIVVKFWIFSWLSATVALLSLF